MPRTTVRPTTLLVSVSATEHVTPDFARLSTGVTSEAKTAAEAGKQNTIKMTAVLKTLADLGVAEDDIRTSALNIHPSYDRNGNKPKLTGYSASNEVTFKLNDLSNLGSVFDALAKAGITQLHGPVFGVTHPEPHLDLARAAAIATARHRATVYAQAAEMKVSRIADITEASSEPRYDRPMRAMAAMTPAGGGAPETPVAPGKVGLTAAIAVTFELAP